MLQDSPGTSTHPTQSGSFPLPAQALGEENVRSEDEDVQSSDEERQSGLLSRAQFVDLSAPAKRQFVGRSSSLRMIREALEQKAKSDHVFNGLTREQQPQRIPDRNAAAFKTMPVGLH